MAEPVVDPAKGNQGDPDPNKGTATTWRQTLSEDIRGEKVFDNFKGEKWEEVGPTLAKSFFEGQKLVGKRVEGMVKVPGKDAKPEEVAAYRKALGVPDTAAGYEFTQPYFPEGMHDANVQTAFLMESHKLGLTTDQVQGLLNWNAGQADSTQKTFASEQQKAKESLQQEWGAAYEVNIALAQKATHWLGGKELYDLVDGSPFGNHPVVLKALVKLGKDLANDGLIDGKIEGVPNASEAQAKINEIMGDTKGPYWIRNHPGHEDAVQQVYKLRQLIAG